MRQSLFADIIARPPVAHGPVHETCIRAAKKSAYYDVQGAHPDFIADLCAFFARAWSERDASEFAARWHLGADAPKDLWLSRRLWQLAPATTPRVIAGSRMAPGLEEPGDDTRASAERDAREFGTRWHLGADALKDLGLRCRLWQLATATTPRVIDDSPMAPGLEDSDGDDRRRQLGYRTWPPALTPRALRRGGSRVCERAVLGRAWKPMAKDDGVTVATVKGGTERYADALGVALPKRARGRPRKAANRAQAFPS